MANVVSQASANERSLRSVFVGNIPYDASEEKLKDIFSEVGPVLSFKLVYDRESGKPKGYGFCEYRDQETAASAMRNLNGYELNSRNLRVDTATNERFKEEMKNLQMSLSGNSFESPYGIDVDPEKTPEAIAKVVASLPPEQMFELARQMKHCVMTNPNEARNMLLQNPQLAYALLQALVVMRAVDPQVASSILYKANSPPMPLQPGNIGPVPGQPLPPHAQGPPPPGQSMMAPSHHYEPPPHDINVAFSRPPSQQGPPGAGPPPGPVPGSQQQQQQPPAQNFDQRHMDPRLRQGPPGPDNNPMIRPSDQFHERMTAPPPGSAQMDPRVRSMGIDPRLMPQQQQQGSTSNVPVRGPTPLQGPPPSSAGSQPPMVRPSQMYGNQPGPGSFPGPQQQQPPPTGPLSGPVASTAVPVAPVSSALSQAVPSSSSLASVSAGQPPPGVTTSGQPNQSEQEKAQLIMQVLALSDQQIAMLPAEQRQSIMMLKEQLSRGGP